MTDCRACHATTRDGWLCKPCVRELEQAIAELPADLRDLELVATRQAAGPLGLGVGRQWDEPPADGALGDAPWQFAPGAADQVWALRNTVITWVRHLCESRDLPLPDATVPLTGWLLRHLDAIRYDEAAGQIHEELTGLHAENERWIVGRPGMDEYFGTCDALDLAADWDDLRGALIPRVAACGAHLFGTADAKEVRCKTCGATYTRAERETAMLRQLDDKLATVRACASTLTKLGEMVTVKQIDGWLRRKLLAPRGFVLESGRSVRLIRVGDVREQRTAMIERATTRRKRTAA